MSYSVHARSRQCVCKVREPQLVAYHLSRVVARVRTSFCSLCGVSPYSCDGPACSPGEAYDLRYKHNAMLTAGLTYVQLIS